MRIIAENWENNSNKIKELENRIIAKIWSIIISSLVPTQYIAPVWQLFMSLQCVADINHEIFIRTIISQSTISLYCVLDSTVTLHSTFMAAASLVPSLVPRLLFQQGRGLGTRLPSSQALPSFLSCCSTERCEWANFGLFSSLCLGRAWE